MSTEYQNTAEAVRAEAERLREKYGYGQLILREAAIELRRTPAALRYILASRLRRQAPWVQRLLRGRKKMGRKILFSVESVADCLLHGDEPLGDIDGNGDTG